MKNHCVTALWRRLEAAREKRRDRGRTEVSCTDTLLCTGTEALPVISRRRGTLECDFQVYF